MYQTDSLPCYSFLFNHALIRVGVVLSDSRITLVVQAINGEFNKAKLGE